MMKPFVSVIFAALATACAMPSSRIATSYTSPLHYQSFYCEQLQAEGRRLSANISSLAPRLDQAARNDKWIAGLGVLMFPPVPLLALGGNRVQEQEYGRLRGELDAVNMIDVAVREDHGVQWFRTPCAHGRMQRHRRRLGAAVDQQQSGIGLDRVGIGEAWMHEDTRRDLVRRRLKRHVQKRGFLGE